MIVVYIFMQKIEFIVKKAPKYPFLRKAMGIEAQIPTYYECTISNGD